jgi:hypothetical protein
MNRFPILVITLAITAAAAQTTPTPPAPSAPAPAPTPTPATAPAAAKPDAGPLAPLAWLEGCWRGTAGPREFREQWMPLSGAMMIGVSQTVEDGVTKGFEYLRLEPRAEGVFYVVVPSGKTENAFRLEGETVDKTMDRNDTIFTFVNPRPEPFPERISYRRATEGWLYASVEGKVNGAERKAIYPMHRISCETGELIER